MNSNKSIKSPLGLSLDRLESKLIIRSLNYKFGTLQDKNRLDQSREFSTGALIAFS